MNAVSMLALARRIAFASLISALLQTSLFGQYLITQLNAPGYQADYVIITSPNYLSAIEPLAAMRFTLSKLSVGIALTDSIYRWVGPTAAPDSAIRDFISFAVANWAEPKPKYFVLAGNVNSIPSHKEAGLFIFYTSEDSIMVDQWFVEGPGSLDSLGMPLATIGRLPAWNLEQMETMVLKTTDYETAPPAAWNRRSIGVADYDTISGSVFEQIVYSRQQQLGSVWSDTVSVFLRKEAPQYKDRQQFRALLDEGAALLMFCGGADFYKFSRNSYFTTWDVDSLTNSARLPLCMGLINQRFEKAETLAVSVRLLAVQQVGAIATLAPSGNTYVASNNGYYSVLCSELALDPKRPLGSVLLALRRRYGNTWSGFDRIQTLLGDPAITIKSPKLASAETPASTVPEQFALYQNYPNPFNPSTTIRYELPHASRVSLKVYNTLGQEVATLVNETKPAGVYTAQFDAGSLASGVYFYRLQAGQFVETKKLVLLR